MAFAVLHILQAHPNSFISHFKPQFAITVFQTGMLERGSKSDMESIQTISFSHTRETLVCIKVIRECEGTEEEGKKSWNMNHDLISNVG